MRGKKHIREKTILPLILSSFTWWKKQPVTIGARVWRLSSPPSPGSVARPLAAAKCRRGHPARRAHPSAPSRAGGSCPGGVTRPTPAVVCGGSAAQGVRRPQAQTRVGGAGTPSPRRQPARRATAEAGVPLPCRLQKAPRRPLLATSLLLENHHGRTEV